MPVIPPYLQPGDTIAIAATARKVSAEEIQPAVDLYRSWGLNVMISDELFAVQHQFGGDDAHRAAVLQRCLDDAQVKAIMCARGGYGTVRLIDRLDFSAFAQQPKWIAGYSDITVLHSHIHRHFGIATLHSTMLVGMQDEASRQSLREALFGQPLSYDVPAHAFNRNGSAEAELVGGNLSVLYSLLGSASDIDTSGKILFLEDLDEYLYHIDRMMMNMQRTGKLSQLAGLVIGGMSDMKDNTIPFGATAEEIVRQHVQAYNYPVCFGFPAGHGTQNLALKLGAPARLQVSAAGTHLSF